MEHPITPPPELVRQWLNAAIGPNYEQCIATAAAQWGPDQELEACIEWTTVWISAPEASQLRAARRPKPPSLKEHALEALEQVEADFKTGSFGDTIRRALEQLND
jgi:hypothetical protein